MFLHALVYIPNLYNSVCDRSNLIKFYAVNMKINVNNL